MKWKIVRFVEDGMYHREVVVKAGTSKIPALVKAWWLNFGLRERKFFVKIDQ